MNEPSPYEFVRQVGRLDQLLERSARSSPGAPLLHLPGGVTTYAQARQRSEEFALALVRAGVTPGDRVAVLAENGLAYVAAFYGAMRAGCVAVPINTAADPASLGHVLRDSGARALAMTDRFLGVAETALGPKGSTPGLDVIFGRTPSAAGTVRCIPWDPESSPGSPDPAASAPDPAASGPDPAASAPAPGGSPDDPAAIIYTSGSTGVPRGATLTHRNILTNTWSILEYLRLRADDRMLVVLPFYYVYGMSLLNTHVAVGASLIVGTELFFPNRVVGRMHSDAATGFAGVPSSFNVLLHRSRLKEDVPPSLRYVTQAGGAMAPELTRELIRALPGVKIFVMYGATEASARLAYLPPERLVEKIGSIGHAIPGVTLRVVREDGSEAGPGEPGELVAAGDNIMQGYWNAPEETAKVLGPDGLRTGDLAKRDEDGFLYIVGRKKEMIKSGAHRISPKEIEERLVEHPGVLEAAVLGIPDELLGEAILAVVVRHGETSGERTSDPETNRGVKSGADVGEAGTKELLNERDLQRFLLERMAEYKVPRRIVFLESLPKNESGKVQKRDLQARFGREPA